MAGFFGFFDYTKPGPGIPKDAPPKHRFIIFFEVLSRKFWKLVQLNMLYFICSIPAFILMLIFSMFLYQSSLVPDPSSDLFTRLILGSIFVCVPLIVVGPAAAGFNYVLRNFSREEHAWVFSDFKEHALKNFKESMIICVIDLVVCFLFAINLNFYHQAGQTNFFLGMVKYFLIAAFGIFVLMHLYIYPMLVTYKLSIRQIYKNSFIFAILKLFQSLGFMLICIGLIIMTFYFNPFIGLILFPLITMSVVGLIINFYVNTVMKKYIIDPVEKVKEETLPETGEDDKIFSETVVSKNEEEER